MPGNILVSNGKKSDGKKNYFLRIVFRNRLTDLLPFSGILLASVSELHAIQVCHKILQ